MVYPNLKFPKVLNRPFFYTNFVSTVDGQVAVKESGYWPIGSKKDHQVLLELRAYADCLVVGGNLARQFGNQIQNSLKQKDFQTLRQKLGKDSVLPYYIISKDKSLGENVISPNKQGIGSLINFFKEKNFQNVLIEGGPTLLTSFLKKGLIDQIFLTISPKIFGSKKDLTLNLIEGYLFPAQDIIKLELVSVKQFNNELFLRYGIIK